MSNNQNIPTARPPAMSVPNSRIENALNMLREDRRREVYEGADFTGKLGTGEYFITYSNGRSPKLTQTDVREMAWRGWIVPHPQVPGMFIRGALP